MKSFREGDIIGNIDFTNAVVNLLSTISLLKSDINGHLINPELRQQLVAKLPYALQLQWGEYVSRYFGSLDSTLQNFSDWLSDRADAASFLITQKACEEQHQPRARSSEDRRHVTGASTTHCLEFSISIQEAENELTELDVTERKEFPMKNRLCFNCFRQHDRVVNCRIKSSCIKCKGKHHTVLHEYLVDHQENNLLHKRKNTYALLVVNLCRPNSQ